VRRADRLFRLVLLLRGGRFTTAATLARELSVSERTIYRDVRDLVLNGVPIDGEAGAGYRLRGSFELPPLMFDAEEAAALVLGARMVDAWADPKLAAASRRVMEKVSQAAPPELRESLERQDLLVPDFHINREQGGRFGEVRSALEGSRRVWIEYTDADGCTTEREIRPLGLFYWGGGWSVGAWCELRQDFRNFRLDRVRALRIAASFESEDGKTLADFLRCVREG